MIWDAQHILLIVNSIVGLLTLLGVIKGNQGGQ